MEKVYKDLKSLFAENKRFNPNFMYTIIALFLFLAAKLKTLWWDPVQGDLAWIISLFIVLLSLRVVLQGRDIKVIKIYKTKQKKQGAI